MIRRLAFVTSCVVLLALLSLLPSGILLAAGGESASSLTRDAAGHEILFAIAAGGDGVHYSATGTEMLTWGPTALTLAPDGSFWIADAVANRLLHYSARGQRLPSVEISPHKVVGVGDIEVTASAILVLDHAAITPRVLKLSLAGRLLASYDVPRGLGLENGLSGIALGDGGSVLLEREGGALVSQLVTTRGVVAPRALEGYSFHGRLYSARAADLSAVDATRGVITAGATRIEVQVANALGGLRILGAAPSGIYAVVEEVALVNGAVTVDQTVRQYSVAGDVLGLARAPLAEQYVPVAHGLAVGPDGAVYALVTLPDRVNIERLSFSRELASILPNTPVEKRRSTETIAPALACVSRDTMLATAQGYINNSKYLNAANTDGACARRVKPHYLAGPGTYPSVSYDLGGFDTVSAWNGYMDPNTFQAGDAPDPGNIESCSKGVDCSGFVSRVWQLPSKHWTGSIPNVSSVLASVNDLRPGDVMNDPDEHVMLFDSFAANGIRVYESTSSQNFDRVVYNFRPWDFLTGYTPRRYNNVCQDAVPAAPTSLAASVVSSTQINLSWNAPAGEKDGYKVYYANGAYISSTTGTSLPVMGLAPCTDYSFYVKAYKGSLESAASNTASARSGRLAQTGEISGRAKDVAGNPVAVAAVSASTGGAPATTDATGGYALCGVPAGALRLTASKDGYASGFVDVTASATSPVIAPTITLTPTCPSGQFRGEYFNNRTLSGSPLFVRCESGIRYDWGSGSPGNGIANDNFSVRWTGRFTFDAGTHTFIARSDDGVRLWVDGGSALIDAWWDRAAAESRATRTLTAGEHEVKVKYYEHLGRAVAQVRWEQAGSPGHLRITSVRFTPIQVVSGSLLEVRVGVTNDGGAPLTMMGPDDATYNEDGSSPNARPSEAGKWRVGVEGEGRPADMLDHPYRFGRDQVLNPGDSALVGGYIRLSTPGSTDVWVGAVQELVRWDADNIGRTRVAVTPSACPAGQFLAQYYNGRDMVGSPVFSRCETTIANNWGSGGPSGGLGNNNFSVRWTGRYSFNARSYTFIARTDDGMRLWLDGALILDKWFDQAAREYRITRAMSAGEHVIQVDYYENAGGAVAQVKWE